MLYKETTLCQISPRREEAPVTNRPRLTVGLSFDFDAQSGWISDGSRDLTEISRGEFAIVGIDRVLRLLARRNIAATFFVPGHTALSYPDIVRRIADEGHEIGHHGWVHEHPASLTELQERHALERGFEELAAAAGVRPIGYRAPGAGFSTSTADLLAEYGFEYDSSCGAQDYYPYYLRRGDRWSTDGPYHFGTPSEIVEVPFSWALDDFPLIELKPSFTTTQFPPSHVREIWQEEFEFAYEECEGGVYQLCMHPDVIGRGRNIRMLDSLLDSFQARPGVTFSTLGEVAANWRSDHPSATAV
jgi:peptidoglycan/xylan/chitin deacetylase (PgdA/CDA1 family)